MKIYTRTGDQGYSALFSGRRVPKNHLALEAFGGLDELNSHIGLLLSSSEVQETRIVSLLTKVQNQLFHMGSMIASDGQLSAHIPELHAEDVQTLESAIDTLEATLPPLKNFILPRGSWAACQTHICRTVCRRAERHVVALQLIEDKNYPISLQYLNRLSDYFFVLARYFNDQQGEQEDFWDKNA